MNTECIVIGAGLIGLACARQLAMAGHEVVILEAANAIGTETSSRNSEVIHAGIYYPKGSLKANLCVHGKNLLYQYCVSHGIEYKRLGKLIVATSEDEVPQLKIIKEKAVNNGVHDIEYLTQQQITSLEPAINAKAALYSPSTGIIDSHGLMLALLGDAEANGAMLALRSPFIKGEIKDDGIHLLVAGENDETENITAKIVINAAGLSAPVVPSLLQGFPSKCLYQAYYCKGSYFTLGTQHPFKHLIYPVPSSAGLGVHVTLDLAGQARFGPDTEWIDKPNYDMDIKKADSFYKAIRRY